MLMCCTGVADVNAFDSEPRRTQVMASPGLHMPSNKVTLALMGLRFRVQGSWSRFQGPGFRGFRVQGSGSIVEGFGCRVTLLAVDDARLPRANKCFGVRGYLEYKKPPPPRTLQ